MRSTHLFKNLLMVILLIIFISCQSNPDVKKVPQWQETELVLSSAMNYPNAYTDVGLEAVFTNQVGKQIIRPAFWDGDNTWKIRFTSPDDSSTWSWVTTCSNPKDKGLHQQHGIIKAVPNNSDNIFQRHGLLKMSPGKRNVIHTDGTPFILVGDTPWALPWRATLEDVQIYARDRQQKGFNAALLMTIQPDRDAEGPEARNTEQGFARAFTDIKAGHINQINIPYFQYLDSIINILLAHQIVPVYQPVFHGYGWKGQNVLGWDMDANEYSRFTQYLVARYGARAAMWLVSGDSDGKNTGVLEAGETVEKWDAYQQPTGIHYNPYDEAHPDWGNGSKGAHYNKVHQEKEWLDFQWCQTGHGGEHLYHKVEKMYHNMPVKAVANGEPTYEGIREPGNGSGWWQGEEAWMQLVSGGTMGVVYGAGGLWNWKITASEPGWPEWANSMVSWKEALELEGSTYVGHLAKALNGFDVTDMEKRPELIEGSDYLLAKPGHFYLTYLPDGGSVRLKELPQHLKYYWFNPVDGKFLNQGVSTGQKVEFTSPNQDPWVLIIGTGNNLAI